MAEQTQSYLEQVGTDFDHLSPEFFAHMWGVLGALRDESPVHRNRSDGGFVAVTRYDDVARVANDWRSFTSAQGVAPSRSFSSRLLPADADPPLHGAIRSVLNPHFRPAVVREMEDHIRELTVELLDTFSERGECDFVSEFASVLPGRVVYEAVLGAPRGELANVLRMVKEFTSNPNESSAVLKEYISWVDKLCEQRSAALDDGEPDVISVMLDAEIQGQPIDRETRGSVVALLIIAALDTTLTALTSIVHALATRPDIAESLQGADEQLLRQAVDEFLRWESPVPAMSRHATCPVAIGDTTIEPGERVLLYFGAANRDESHFPHADQFDLHREHNDHMAFGRGIHTCLGAHVARLELRVALEEILKRMPNLAIAPGADISFHGGMSRSRDSLRVTFRPTPASRASEAPPSAVG